MSEILTPTYSVNEPVIVAGATYTSDYSEKEFHEYVVLPKSFVEEHGIVFPEEVYYYEIEGKHSEIIEDMVIKEMSLEEAYGFLNNKHLESVGEDIIYSLKTSDDNYLSEGYQKWLIDFHRNLSKNLFNTLKNDMDFCEITVKIPQVMKAEFLNFVEGINGRIS